MGLRSDAFGVTVFRWKDDVLDYLANFGSMTPGELCMEMGMDRQSSEIDSILDQLVTSGQVENDGSVYWLVV